MCRKKRILCCAVIAIVVFTGCSSANGGISSSPHGNTAASSTTLQGASNVPQASPKSARYLSSYTQSVTPAGYYYIENRTDVGANIKYLDFASQQSIVLCHSPECTHNVESCRGWIGNVYNTPQIICTDDKLLLVYPGNAYHYEMSPKTMFAHIDSMNLDGSDKKTIASYASNLMFTNCFAMDGNTLYYQLDVYDLEKGADKTTSLECLNLTTGQRETLKSGLSERTFFMGASGQALYCKEIILADNATDARAAYENQQHRISKMSLTTGEETEVFSWKQDTLQEIFVDNELLCVTNDFAVNCVNLEDKTQKILLPANDKLQEVCANFGENVSIQPLFLQETILVCKLTSVGKKPVDTKDTLIALDLQSQTVSFLNITANQGAQEPLLSISAVTKDSVVIVSGYNEVQTTFSAEDGTIYPVSLPQPIFDVVPMNDFLSTEK